MSVTPHASPSTSKLKAVAHTPMSERQQLALIKQIEAKTVSPGKSDCQNVSSFAL